MVYYYLLKRGSQLTIYKEPLAQHSIVTWELYIFDYLSKLSRSLVDSVVHICDFTTLK